MPAINISNGVIEAISSERGTTFVTVTYRRSSDNTRNEQTVRLVVTSHTAIINTNGSL